MESEAKRMFEIDKKKFGAFLSQLRKEQGYTQKDLAQKLFLSDKAVSKWETGVSFPDTALLVPLADLFGVTVTELLMCERMEKEQPIHAEQVETIVKTAISCSGETAARAYQTKSKWKVLYPVCVIAGMAGALMHHTMQIPFDTMATLTVLGAVFGAYFCFFVKTKLPAYYDGNRCGLYDDRAFRMNIPGVAFNNSNWPYIVRAGRAWSCLTTALCPAVNIGMHRISPELWQCAGQYIFLALVLGGLFLSIYAAGKKYG